MDIGYKVTYADKKHICHIASYIVLLYLSRKSRKAVEYKSSKKDTEAIRKKFQLLESSYIIWLYNYLLELYTAE